jgi:hypothetical protein
VVAGVKGLGGAADVNYIGTVGDEAPSLTFDGRIDQMLQLKNNSLASARSTETTISQTISTLSQVVTACASTPNVASSANLQKSALVVFRNELATDIVRLSNDVTNLEKMRDAAPGSYTIADIEPAVGTVPAAQDEAKAFAKKRNDSEAALQESSRTLSSCDADASTTVPPPTTTTTTPPLGP